MLIELRLDVIGVSRAHDRLSTERHEISDLALDVEVCVLAQERNAGDRSTFDIDSLHFADLRDVLETDITERQFQRGIDHFTARAARYNDVSNLMPQL